MNIYKPYTYLIGWAKLDKYYYGARYAKNCHPTDLWNPYKTSSPIVKEFVRMYGPPDIISIRKTFCDAYSAIDWEHKVLTRLKVGAGNPKFLNAHNAKGFMPYTSENNPMCFPAVKMKMIKTKRVKGLILLLKNKNTFVPSKNKVLNQRLKNYLQIIEDRPRPYKIIKQVLEKMLNDCDNFKKRSYPQERKSSPRGKMPNIGIAKLCTKWYHDPVDLKTRPFIPGSEPQGWVLGMIKLTPNNNTDSSKKKLSISMKQYRASESDEKKQQRMTKYHETIEKRKSVKY